MFLTRVTTSRKSFGENTGWRLWESGERMGRTQDGGRGNLGSGENTGWRPWESGEWGKNPILIEQPYHSVFHEPISVT